MANLLTQQLDIAARAFKQAAADRFTNNSDAIKMAMSALFSACLLKHQNPELYTETEWQTFAEGTVADVRACLYSIGAYVAKTKFGFDVQWISDDWQSWRKLCRLLSEIAFLMETYHAYISDDDFEVLGRKDVEEFLNTISGEGDLPSDYIPDGIPDSHYWWYLGT